MYFFLIYFLVDYFHFDQIDYPFTVGPIITEPANAQWVVIHRVFDIALGYHVCPVFRIITLWPIKNNPPPHRADAQNARL